MVGGLDGRDRIDADALVGAVQALVFDTEPGGRIDAETTIAYYDQATSSWIDDGKAVMYYRLTAFGQPPIYGNVDQERAENHSVLPYLNARSVRDS